MPVDEKGAKGQGSLSDETGDENPSDEGKSPRNAKSPEQLAKEYKAEAERKAKEIEELKELNKVLIEEKKERLEELKDKDRLSKAEKEEVEDLESQIAAIRSDKRTKAWLELNRKESEVAAQKELAKYDFKRASRLAVKLASKEEVPIEKFEKEIVKHMRIVDPEGELSAVDRLEEAYDSWKSEKAQLEEIEKLKANKDPGKFSEIQNRNPKPSSKREILDNAIGAKRSDAGLRELLKGIQEVQAEQANR